MLCHVNAHVHKINLEVRFTCKVILNVYTSLLYTGSLSKAQGQGRKWITFIRALHTEGRQKLPPELISALS